MSSLIYSPTNNEILEITSGKSARVAWCDSAKDPPTPILYPARGTSPKEQIHSYIASGQSLDTGAGPGTIMGVLWNGDDERRVLVRNILMDHHQDANSGIGSAQLGFDVQKRLVGTPNNGTESTVVPKRTTSPQPACRFLTGTVAFSTTLLTTTFLSSIVDTAFLMRSGHEMPFAFDELDSPLTLEYNEAICFVIGTGGSNTTSFYFTIEWDEVPVSSAL